MNHELFLRVGTSGPGSSEPPFSSDAILISETEDGFQKLQHRLASAAHAHPDRNVLIQLFCREAREFFQVSGVYFWRCERPDELIGEQSDGKLAERFGGSRIGPEQSVVTAQAVRQRRTIFANQVGGRNLPAAAEFGAQSLMGTPVMVADAVMGAVTFLHDTDGDFFNEHLAAKATILGRQLGTLLEAARLSDASREEHRRAIILADVAQALHGTPDVAAVLEALSDRMRLLLRTELVCVLLRSDGPFELRALSAETPQLANAARARHDRQTLRFAADLAQRAVAAGEPITLSIGADVHSLGNLVSPGMLIAAPLRTTLSQGAILVYPRPDAAYTSDEKALISAISGFGAVAMANAELYSTAHAQAHELHQLLEISSQLSSSEDLEQSLQAFVIHAADFLGFGRSFIALLEDGQFVVRYGVESGKPRRLETVFPEGIATRAARDKEVFWTDEASRMPGANLDVISQYKVHQFLAVPLLGAGGQVLGMFGVLDRLHGSGISQEDIRRARALSNHVAVVLEVARNLHLSEQNRKRAEVLIELTREMNSAVRLPEFSRRFVERVIALTGSSAGFLAIRQDGRFQLVALHPPTGNTPTLVLPEDIQTDGNSAEDRASTFDPHSRDNVSEKLETASRQESERRLERILVSALTEFETEHKEKLISGNAEDVLGREAMAALGWKDCTVVRLPRANGDLGGVLGLSGRSRSMEQEDRVLLETVAGHAAMALENASLFTRIEQANRHWVEIFDAIADFIVVHDQAGNVLRVNRSLASTIGVPPAELVGLNIRALLAMNTEFAPYTCPFCRAMAEDSDEFVHPVFDRTFLVSTSRVHGASDEGLQTIHVLKDITDRREAERRYRELFDNIQEGLFFSTPSGRFVEVNDALVRMLGYSTREELLQIDIPTQLYYSAHDRERHTQALEELGSLHNYEATFKRKDGSPIHVLVNAFGLYDNLGRLLQIRGLMLDVTGLRTYQSELHRERDFSAKILNNTQSLILVADTAGLISYANRRWQEAGVQQRDLLGQPLAGLASPEFIKALAAALQSTLDGQQVDNLELQIVREGATGKFSANLSPMRDEQGNVTSIVAVLTDITDSAVLRDKLVHTEKMAAVGQLVSGVAHEVNNPLTAILGFADLLMENPELPESARKDLRVILQEAQRTKQIVQNLLSFARQMPPQRSAVQLNTILRRTVQLRSYDFTNHGVEVVEHLDENLPEVMGDAHQLQQVFLNILNNAYDAVHEVGRAARIEILSTKSGDAVEVSFRDNGNGISHPEKIFDPFFTTKEVGKGTGLGLSICYGIVKEHGGEILCHNNLGEPGATFVVRLPGTSHSASFRVAAGVRQS